MTDIQENHPILLPPGLSLSTWVRQAFKHQQNRCLEFQPVITYKWLLFALLLPWKLEVSPKLNFGFMVQCWTKVNKTAANAKCSNVLFMCFIWQNRVTYWRVQICPWIKYNNQYPCSELITTTVTRPDRVGMHESSLYLIECTYQRDIRIRSPSIPA